MSAFVLVVLHVDAIETLIRFAGRHRKTHFLSYDECADRVFLYNRRAKIFTSVFPLMTLFLI